MASTHDARGMPSSVINRLLVAFEAGTDGDWRIDSITPVTGDALPYAPRLRVVEGDRNDLHAGAGWRLSGATGHARYTTRAEFDALAARQPALRRPEARRAALIPIRKSEAWWAMPQDERRALVEEQSHHIAIGMEYLPAVARRLHHCREIGGAFDFLTWFEYAPEHSAAFEQLVSRLRATPEWRYVDREVDIRLSRDDLLSPEG